jgi:hypothetical protein
LNGVIDSADMAIWRNGYGATAPLGALAAATTAIPEPTLLALTCGAVISFGSVARRRGSSTMAKPRS